MVNNGYRSPEEQNRDYIDAYGAQAYEDLRIKVINGIERIGDSETLNKKDVDKYIKNLLISGTEVQLCGDSLKSIFLTAFRYGFNLGINTQIKTIRG